MRRLALLATMGLALAAPAADASAPPSLAGFTAWASAGPRLAFVATSAGGRKGYLWVKRVDGSAPALLRATPPVGEEEVDRLAAGPKGSWAAAEIVHGAYTRLDVVSSRGGGATVATSGSVRAVVGDGVFLGYLSATPAGAVRLFRISGAHSSPVATLPGLTPGDVRQAVVSGGSLAVLEPGGAFDVYSLAGARLAHVEANAAEIALTAQRVVVRTRDRRLGVYGLRGGLVHNWGLAAAGFTNGLASDGRYALYVGANRALHVVRLAGGRDAVVARSGSGFFFDGAALGPAGAVVPLTTQHGSRVTVTLRFVPLAALRRAVGG
jgi:hypothetical protein